MPLPEGEDSWGEKLLVERFAVLPGVIRLLFPISLQPGGQILPRDGFLEVFQTPWSVTRKVVQE